MIKKFLTFFTNFSRGVKAVILICIDGLIIGFSMLLSFAVRFDPASIEYKYNLFAYGAWVFLGIQLLALMISGLYLSVLRFAGTELLVLLLRSVLLGAGLFALLDLMMEEFLMPRSIIVMNASFTFLGLLSIRLMIR